MFDYKCRDFALFKKGHHAWSDLALAALLDLRVCWDYGTGYLLASLLGAGGVDVGSAVNNSDDLCLRCRPDQLKARLFGLLLLLHA